jgi:transcriptional regulator with XRE-family HTH domain
MDPAEFKAWRKSLGLMQKEAAEKLGLKKRMIQYYETGRRGAKKVVIPRTVELACYALSVGVERFDGAPPETGPVPLPAGADASKAGEKKPQIGSKEAA